MCRLHNGEGSLFTKKVGTKLRDALNQKSRVGMSTLHFIVRYQIEVTDGLFMTHKLTLSISLPKTKHST